MLESCEKLSVKHFKESESLILLNFVNLSTIFCPLPGLKFVLESFRNSLQVGWKGNILS